MRATLFSETMEGRELFGVAAFHYIYIYGVRMGGLLLVEDATKKVWILVDSGHGGRRTRRKIPNSMKYCLLQFIYTYTKFKYIIPHSLS